MADTFFADVSEYQRAVDDSYPYPLLAFRSNDGTYLDKNFATNYAWSANAANTGKLGCFIVYAYWRTNWQDTADALIDHVEAMGGPHPQMVVELDVESGGNPAGDQSDGINGAYWRLTDWLGTTNQAGTRRVIGYANAGDFYSMWHTRPDGLAVIGAGYGSNPKLPGQIAHQYTDGVHSRPLKRRTRHLLPPLTGAGLPLGAEPFGDCDMNSADGYTPAAFAAACGIQPKEAPMSVADTELSKLFPSRSKYRKDDNPVDTLAGFVLNVDARIHEMWTENEARKGMPDALALVLRQANTGDHSAQAVIDEINQLADAGDTHAQAVVAIITQIEAGQ